MIVEIITWFCIVWLLSMISGMIWQLNKRVMISIVVFFLIFFTGSLLLVVSVEGASIFVWEWGSIGSCIGGFTYRIPFSVGKDITKEW